MSIFPVISVVDLIVVFVISWVLASFPVYVAGKIVSGDRTRYSDAMLASLIGPIVTIFFFIIVSALLFPFLLLLAYFVGFIIAVAALSYIYGAIFRTSILGGFAIAIIAFIITVIIFTIVSFIAILLTGQPIVGSMPHPHGIFP